jgi:hypothetical protein
MYMAGKRNGRMGFGDFGEGKLDLTGRAMENWAAGAYF